MSSPPPPPSKDINEKDIDGTLVVVVLKARNLKDKHKFTKQDPFATVQLGKISKSTKVDVRGGQHPVWDEDIHLPVHVNPSKSNRTLTLQCFAKESREDDLLGEGTVDIEETLKTCEFDDWVKLEMEGAYQGEIYLEMTYFPKNPPPRPQKQQKPQQKYSPSPSPQPGASPNAKPNSFPSSLQPGLYRRPSKLPAHERLWRPPQTQTYKASPLASPGFGPQRPGDDRTGRPLNIDGPGSRHSSPSRPPSHSPSPSPRRRNDALPPLPSDGAAVKLAPVPAILRPGNAKSSSTPIPQDANTRVYGGGGAAEQYPQQPGQYLAYGSRPPSAPVSATAPTFAASPPPVPPQTITSPPPQMRIPEPMIPVPQFGPQTYGYGGPNAVPGGFGPRTGAGGAFDYSGSFPDPYARATQAQDFVRPPSSGPAMPGDYTRYATQAPPRPPSASSPHYTQYTTPSTSCSCGQTQTNPRYESPYPVPSSSTPTPVPAPVQAPQMHSAPQTSTSSSHSAYSSHGTPTAPPRYVSQEDADAALAAQLAREEGIDVDKLRAQEADEEFARNLAREINSDVLALREAEERGRNR